MPEVMICAMVMFDFVGFVSVMVRGGLSESIAASPKSMRVAETCSPVGVVCEKANLNGERTAKAKTTAAEACLNLKSYS